jgi:hypothetical protein
MLGSGKQAAALYVDKSHQQWVVRDPDGFFWTMPSDESSWEHREQIDPTTGDFDLEPVPGHYKYMFDLPF